MIGLTPDQVHIIRDTPLGEPDPINALALNNLVCQWNLFTKEATATHDRIGWGNSVTQYIKQFNLSKQL